MSVILLVLACGAPEAPVEPPPVVAPREPAAIEPAAIEPAVGALREPHVGTLLYASEATGSPRATRLSADGTSAPLAGPPGLTFPAEPDPLGTHALLVASVDSPEAGHQESLWLVPLGDGEPVQLGPPAQSVRNPSWAPDGASIVVESDLNSFRDLYRVARDGSGWTRLTEAPHGTFEPSVAPDGRIAFGSSRDGNAEIYVQAPDGSVTRLTDDPTDDTRPRFSPDGARLAWLQRQGLSVRAQLVDRDGSRRPVRPTSSVGVDWDLVWSPDGRTLAITTQSGPKEMAIELVDVESGAVRATLDGPGVDEQPAWSPDGRWLVFTSGRGGRPDLWRVRADGSDPVQLTRDPVAAWLPRWTR